MHIKPDKTITIMADFGFGPYAWLKDASDESDYVGMNIANLKTGMTDFKISKQLEVDFAMWIDRFERDALDNPEFPWSSFHEEGIRLSRRLKEEVGDAANVLYVKPFEDPQHQTDEKIWIYSKTEQPKNEYRERTMEKSPELPATRETPHHPHEPGHAGSSGPNRRGNGRRRPADRNMNKL